MCVRGRREPLCVSRTDHCPFSAHNYGLVNSRASGRDVGRTAGENCEVKARKFAVGRARNVVLSPVHSVAPSSQRPIRLDARQMGGGGKFQRRLEARLVYQLVVLWPVSLPLHHLPLHKGSPMQPFACVSGRPGSQV
ncbi:hypothetical protein MTO96_049200 [Rhipicephalus appendiculatus]